MNNVYTLIGHLKECPPAFLQESNLLDTEKGLDTNALLLDLFREYSLDYILKSRLEPDLAASNYTSDHLRAMQIAVWFFSSKELELSKTSIVNIQSFLFQDLLDLSNYVKYNAWLEDDDRAEEFVRTALMACEILPQGENVEEAMDRLESISILKRNNALLRSKKAFERVMEIRRKMAAKKAREAANVYGRE